MTGCWFSRHQFVRAAHDFDRGQLAERHEADAAGRARATGVPGRRGRGGRQADRQLAKSILVEADAVGIADADFGHSILLGNRAGHLAVEGGVELRSRCPFSVRPTRARLHAVGPDHDVRIAREKRGVRRRSRPAPFLTICADLLGQAARAWPDRGQRLDFDRRFRRRPDR